MIGEVDGERAQPPTLLAGDRAVCQRRHGRGIESAREQAAQRHIGNDLQPDDVIQQFGNCLDRPRQIMLMLARGQAPVLPFRQAIPVDAHDLPRPYLAHAGVNRALGILSEHEQFAKAVRVHARLHAGMREDRLRLGAEQHPVLAHRVVQRLHPQPVAGEEQLLPPPVPDAEREHAVETLGKLVAPLQVSAQHDFRVAAGLEVVTELLQLVAQLDEIIHLSGIDERSRGLSEFLRLHRLDAARDVDDGEPTMPQTGVSVDPYAARVRTAARHGFRHRRDDVSVCLEVDIVAYPTGYAAHAMRPFQLSCALGACGRAFRCSMPRSKSVLFLLNASRSNTATSFCEKQRCPRTEFAIGQEPPRRLFSRRADSSIPALSWMRPRPSL